ncbi:MAG: hypothetical protein AAF497_24675, partial [Planctomycetota bacterium]
MFESAAQNAVAVVWFVGLVVAMWKFVEQPVTSLFVGCSIILFLVATGFGTADISIGNWGDVSYWIIAVAFVLLIAAAYIPLNPTFVRQPEMDIQAIISQRDLAQREFEEETP